MPSKPKKPCAFPGCPNLTFDAYCEEHAALRQKQYDKCNRAQNHDKKYGTNWRRSKRFKFLKESEAAEEPNKWFKVKDVLKFDDEYSIFSFASKKYEDELAGKNICAIFKVLTSKDIGALSLYEIEE